MFPDAPADDGLQDYEIGPWTRDKLAILSAYLPEFAKACSKSRPRGSSPTPSPDRASTC
jgi:hypothetical protein